jgi:hypothetical protein
MAPPYKYDANGEIITDPETGLPILRSTGKSIHPGYSGGQPVNLWGTGNLSDKEMAEYADDGWKGDRDPYAEGPRQPPEEDPVIGTFNVPAGEYRDLPEGLTAPTGGVGPAGGGLALGVEGVGATPGGFQPTEPTMPELQLKPVRSLEETQAAAQEAMYARMKPHERAAHDYHVGSLQTEDSIRAAAATQKSALDQQAEIAVARSDEQHAAMGAADKEAKHRMRRAEAMEKAADQSATKNINDFKQRTEDYKNMRVDDDFWNRKGGGQSTALLLGAMAGGWLEVMSGGAIKNKVLGIIENAIDRDIGMQEREIARAGTALGLQQDIYSMEALNWDTKVERELAGRIRIYDAVKRQIDTIGMKFAGSEAEANAKMLKGQIDEKQGAAIHSLKSERYGAKMNEFKLQEQIRARRQAAAHQRKMLKLKRAEAPGYQFPIEAVTHADPKSPWHGREYGGQKLFSIGEVNPALDKPEGRELRKKIGAGHKGLMRLTSLIEKLEEYGWDKGFSWERLDDAQRASVRALQKELAVSMRNANEVGVMTDPDYKRWTEIVPGMKDLKDMFKGSTLKTLEDLRDRTISDQQFHVGRTFKPNTIDPTYYRHMKEYYQKARWQREVDAPPDEFDKVAASGDPTKIVTEALDLINTTEKTAPPVGGLGYTPKGIRGARQKYTEEHGDLAKEFMPTREGTWADLEGLRGRMASDIARKYPDPGPAPSKRERTKGGKWAKKEWATRRINTVKAYQSYAKHLGVMSGYAEHFMPGRSSERTTGGVSFFGAEEPGKPEYDPLTQEMTGRGRSTQTGGETFSLYGHGQRTAPKWMSSKEISSINKAFEDAVKTQESRYNKQYKQANRARRRQQPRQHR